MSFVDRTRAFLRAHKARIASLPLAALAVALLLPPASDAALRSFSSRHAESLKGNFTIVANTLMTCPAANVACAPAQGGGGASAALNNNNYVMRYVDTDADATTFDSSQATLTLPAGATVTWAGLYWGADTSAGGGGGVAAPNAALAGTVQLTPPGGGASTVTASVLDNTGARYQGFAEVTSIVDAAGAGDYVVANVQAGTGQDRYAGWALVVVYSANSEPTRNVTVFDGFQVVQSSGPTSIVIPVSGFLTPPSGAVKTTLGLIGYEGDLGLVGDGLTLASTTPVGAPTLVTDAQNPSTNFFNSSISRLGSRVTSKTPDYSNQLGFDADIVDVSSALPNGSSAASISLTTGGETYFPGVVVFATELYAPDLLTTIGKTVTDLNGGDVNPGDTLEYTVSFSNVGSDGATNVVLTDPIPADTTFVPGSLQVVTGANAGVKTNGSGDDQAELAGSNVVFRLGSGADATSGGQVAPTEQTSIRFRVTVDATTPGGTSISNTATLDYNAQTLGTAYSGSSPTATVTVVRPSDLAITKTSSPGRYVPGASLTYTIVVTNGGPFDALGASVADVLPTQLSGATWSCASGCAPASGSGDVATSVDVPVGGSVTIVVTAIVLSGTTGSLTNTATVDVPAGSTDPSPGNNSATDTNPKAPAPAPAPPRSQGVASADLRVSKAGPATANVGETISFAIGLTSAGPGAARDVVLTDTLPPDLAPVSVAAPSGVACGFSGQTLTCPVGELAAGGSVAVTVTVRVVGGAGGSVVNVVFVQSSTPDHAYGSNTARASVAIGVAPPAVTPKPGPTTKPKPVAKPVPVRRPVLRLFKRWAPKAIRAGATAKARIVVLNVGRGVARNVTVCDRPSASLSFVAARGAFYKRGAACWRIRRLDPRSSRVFVAVLRADATTKRSTVPNVAVASGANTTRVVRVRAVLRVRGVRAAKPGGVTG